MNAAPRSAENGRAGAGPGDGLDWAGHLAQFGRALRERGVRVALSDEADGLEALIWIDLSDRDEVRRALAVAFKIRPHDRAAFDELFERLWAPPSAPKQVSQALGQVTRQRSGGVRPAAEAIEVDAASPSGEELGYSPDAVLRKKPFDECAPEDLAAMENLIARLALRLATRKSRRLVPTRGRGAVDLRRSFRRALAHGGEFLALARRARPLEQPRLLVLADTSGSMDPHVRFLLQFVVALGRVAPKAEIFAFNTSLVRITPLLRPKTLAPGLIEATLARLAAEVPDWSGGTRIGECLREFVDRHLATRVDHRTVVLIFSDGLDRGDVAPIAEAMRALSDRAKSILWLNPLAGDARYEPSARAMAAALPYVDRLLPAHNLESLERLVPHLSL
ncbi:MAG TPA: VWA domain-containing protein [Thermoanaerobaculia bacterium]|nr:VWA domain-containing protein [Thermoanaerobaculia bacterium]